MVALGWLGGKKARDCSKGCKEEVGEGLVVVRFLCLVVDLDQTEFDDSFGDFVYVLTAAPFSDSSDNE